MGGDNSFFCLFVSLVSLKSFVIKVIAKWDVCFGILIKSLSVCEIFCQMIVLAWEPDFVCGMRAKFGFVA